MVYTTNYSNNQITLNHQLKLKPVFYRYILKSKKLKQIKLKIKFFRIDKFSHPNFSSSKNIAIEKKPIDEFYYLKKSEKVKLTTEKKRVGKKHYEIFSYTKKVVGQKKAIDSKYMKIFWLRYFLVKKKFMYIFSLSRIFEAGRNLNSNLTVTFIFMFTLTDTFM